MKRLRRAYQRQTSKRNKFPCTRSGTGFRQRAIAAGTAAAITLGAGAGLNKALAKDASTVGLGSGSPLRSVFEIFVTLLEDAQENPSHIMAESAPQGGL